MTDTRSPEARTTPSRLAQSLHSPDSERLQGSPPQLADYFGSRVLPKAFLAMLPKDSAPPSDAIATAVDISSKSKDGLKRTLALLLVSSRIRHAAADAVLAVATQAAERWCECALLREDGSPVRLRVLFDRYTERRRNKDRAAFVGLRLALLVVHLRSSIDADEMASLIEREPALAGRPSAGADLARHAVAPWLAAPTEEAVRAAWRSTALWIQRSRLASVDIRRAREDAERLEDRLSKQAAVNAELNERVDQLRSELKESAALLAKERARPAQRAVGRLDYPLPRRRRQRRGDGRQDR